MLTHNNIPRLNIRLHAREVLHPERAHLENLVLPRASMVFVEVCPALKSILVCLLVHAIEDWNGLCSGGFEDGVKVWNGISLGQTIC